MRHVCVRALLGVESLSQFTTPEKTDTEYDIIMAVMCVDVHVLCLFQCLAPCLGLD